jgi:hypothetical protein
VRAAARPRQRLSAADVVRRSFTLGVRRMLDAHRRMSTESRLSNSCIGESSNGRTLAFEAKNLGSTPSSPAIPHLMCVKFVVIDNCPVPASIAPKIRTIQKSVQIHHGYHPTLQSCYRGNLAKGLLHRLHKSTQAMLYYGFLRHLPGYNPANPPGRSTHELFSDGVAYRGPVGRPLLPWQVGMDFNDTAIPHLKEAARRHGWELFQPYPSGSEYHHLNFRRKPR